MQTLKVRIRKDFAPLNVAVSIVNLNPQGSPMLQRYTERTQSFEPNHAISPLVLGIKSKFTAKESNGKIVEYSSADLAEMKWLLDGVDISTLKDWAEGTDYTISTAIATKGMITIKKNFTPGYHHDLQLTAVLPDKRLGTRIQVATDPVTIGCDNSSEDKYSMDFGEDTSILYNPFLDLQARYDYMTAHGYAMSDKDKQEAEKCMDSYKRTIPVHVYRGSTMITTGYSVELYRVDGNGTKTLIPSPAESDMTEVVELATDKVVLDLRLVGSDNYSVVARSTADKRQLAEKQFSIGRVYPVYRLTPINGGDIAEGEESHYSEVQCMSNGRVIDHPERIIKIDWFTDTAKITHAGSHGEGDKVDIKLDRTGIGDTYEDDWLDIYNESKQKEEYSLAADADGTVFVDENGSPFIFN